MANILFVPPNATNVTLRQFSEGQLDSTSQVNLAWSFGLRTDDYLDGTPSRIKAMVAVASGVTGSDLESLGNELLGLPQGLGQSDQSQLASSTLDGKGAFVFGAAGSPAEQFILIPVYKAEPGQDGKFLLTPQEVWVSEEPWSFLSDEGQELLDVARENGKASVGILQNFPKLDPFSLPRFLDLTSFPVNVTFDGELTEGQYVRFGVSLTSVVQVVIGEDEPSVEEKYRQIRIAGDFDIPVPSVPTPNVEVYFDDDDPVTRTLTITQFQPFGLSTDLVLALTLS